MWTSRVRQMLGKEELSYLARRLPVRVLQIGCFIHLFHDHVVDLRPSFGASMMPTSSGKNDLMCTVRMSTLKLLTNAKKEEDQHAGRHHRGMWGGNNVKSDQSMGTGIAVGDMITYKSPVNPSQTNCKRVIGLPGDTVLLDPRSEPSAEHELEWKSGKRDITESSRNRERSAFDKREPRYVVVPKGHVWLTGDNLANSTDSRDYGPVPLALLEGLVVARVYPSMHRFQNALRKV